MSFKGQANSIKSSPAFRWTVGVGAGAVLALSLVLLFLLTQATGNRELYERNYARLLVLNIAVAVLLLAVIGWIVLRLYLRLRQGRFGSRLLVKLAAIFAASLLVRSFAFFLKYALDAACIPKIPFPISATFK